MSSLLLPKADGLMANESNNGPEGFGARFTVTFLFPK